MFQQLPCTLELSEKFGRDRPEFSLSVRFEAEKRLPLTKCEIYEYRTPKAEYYFALKIQKVIDPELYITCIGEYDKEELIAGLRIFNKTVKLFENSKRFAIGIDETYKEAEFNLHHTCFPTINYYMTPDQEKLLLNAPELPVPDGYNLGFLGYNNRKKILDLATINDAKTITDCWPLKRKGPGEEEQTRMKLSAFPSTCIRYKGELIACELVHASGMLNNLFVFPEHRGKGLGLVVQYDMAKRLIKENHYVFGTVEIHNTPVINDTDQSPYWTRRTKPDGSTEFRNYIFVR